MIHLEVAVAAPLEQTLTYSLYSLPAQEVLTDPAAGQHNYVGRRVLVPLGRQKVTGYVLARLPVQEDTSYKIREIDRFLDDFPLFHETLVPFYRWVASYYHYPLGLVIKAALPGGLAPKSGRKLILKKSPEQLQALFENEIPPWVEKLLHKGELDTAESSKLLGSKKEKRKIARLVEDGTVAVESVAARDGVRQKYEVCYTPVAGSGFQLNGLDGSRQGLQQYRQRINREMGLSLKVSEVRGFFTLQQLVRENDCDTIALKELRKSYSGAKEAMIALEAKQLVTRCRKRVYRSPFGSQLKHYPRPEMLTGEQLDVLDRILPAIRSRIFRPFLLHGVTGCGKTEVYLRAAEETLALGRDVIILVPEIALATQLEAHLLSRFGDLVVLLHSGMSASERYDQFYLALTGKAKVVIGARSALFAPCLDPGLIIVDEEHDAGFKQDDNFRYHGRDSAVVRAKHHDAVVILGSATPSITSYANAQSGKYTLLTMKNRVGSASLPVVNIVDLNSVEAKESTGVIKAVLREKLAANLADGRQSILLLNRRGFSAVVLCRDCGTPVQCSHCHVSLTLHKEKKRLICHYCGFSTNHKTICLQCGSSDLVPAGFGTERIEEEVVELFPQARVRRLDSDTAADRKKFLAILAEMHGGEIDILIGTQMIAKGHHFPNVTLVGVVWADGGMSMPDFRAAERTFQLITQVIGRAGRGKQPGEVIIQTMRPDHYAIVYSRDHQYGELFAHEMKLRQNPAFPPYLRLTAFLLQGPVESEVRMSAVRLAGFCRRAVKGGPFKIDILGPAPAPLDKIKDNYRWRLLLKGRNTDELHALCKAVKDARQELMGSKCRLAIDVDPENMM